MSLPYNVLSERIDELHNYFSQVGVEAKPADCLIMQDLTLVKKPSKVVRVIFSWHYRSHAASAIQLLDKSIDYSDICDTTRKAEFIKNALLSILQRTDPSFKKLASSNSLLADLSSHDIDCKKLQNGALSPEDYPDWLEEKLENGEFLPLTTALFSQDEARIVKVLQAGAQVNKQDAQGYTAAHFAAILGSLTALRILKEHGADFTMKTRLEGTVYDFLRHRGFRAESEANLFSAEALLCIWKDAIYPNINPHINAAFQAALENDNEPPVILKTIDSEDSPLQGQRELVASRDIKRGEFIIEYTGYVTSDRQINDSTYCLELTKSTTIDSKERGTLARFINHGAPNCVVEITYCQGTPRSALFALRDISEKEPLLIDYSSFYFRNRRPYELNPHFLDKWIATMTLTASAIQKVFNEESDTLEGYLIIKEKKLMYFYLYDFPDHLINCIEEGRLTKEEALEFIDAIKTHAKSWCDMLPADHHTQIAKRIQVCRPPAKKKIPCLSPTFEKIISSLRTIFP